jgi:N-acetylglucosamine transport system permease protein
MPDSKDRLIRPFVHAGLIFWALVTGGPVVWAILSSLKTEDDLLSRPWGLPSKLEFSNWVRAWQQAHIGRYLLNSALVVTASVTLTMALGAMAAYALARYEFRGRRIVYLGFVSGMMFPVFLALVPLFAISKNLGLIGTYHGLALVYAAFGLPFTIFFLTAFFRSLPQAIAEAAVIDGCSHFSLFTRIMLPMAKPGLVSVGIFNVLGQWNQYVLPLVLMQGDESVQRRWVLAQGVRNLAVTSGYRGDHGALLAGLTLSMLPVLLVYLVFHRKLQEGLAAGGLK